MKKNKKTISISEQVREMEQAIVIYKQLISTYEDTLEHLCDSPNNKHKEILASCKKLKEKIPGGLDSHE